MRLPKSAQVLLSLIAGLGVGLALSFGGLPQAWPDRIVAALEPIGTLWVNGLRMTIIPLIIALLIVGVASSTDTRRTGRLGLRAFVMFYGLLVTFAIVTAMIAPSIFRHLVLDPASTEALRASAHVSLPPAEELSFKGWLISLVPTNPIKAAADGATLPVVVFTLIYAFALARATPSVRESQVRFFRGIGDVMLIVVRFVLALAPLGVFALAVTLGFHLRGSALGALGFYVGINAIALSAALFVVYVLVIAIGRVPLARFARAVLPAQTVAFSSRSSLASLPTLIEGAGALGLPEPVRDFVLPLAVSMFRLGPSINWVLGALFIGCLYGVHLGATQIATVAISAVVLNATIPGIFAGGQLVQVPVFAAIGLPIEGIGILIAIDTVVDMLRTTLNVTADMAVAVIVARFEPRAAASD